MSLEQTFSYIYARNVWGGTDGELFSGRGSSNPQIVGCYVQAVKRFLRELPFGDRRVVDLGCGNFNIGAQFVEDCCSYVGVDIVPEVIASLQKQYRADTIAFKVANIVSDELPHGRICMLRQVLQHLSNSEILRVLPKLSQYEFVVVTEHFPNEEYFVAPNLDKSHGPHIRLERGSAVCLDQPPFSLSRSAMRVLVEVHGDGTGEDRRAGIIRTFVIPGIAFSHERPGFATGNVQGRQQHVTRAG